MNWADWCFLKYFSTDLRQKTPLSFPTIPSGNDRRFSLFQEWSACIKHWDAPVLTLGGQPETAFLSVISSAPTGPARPSWWLNIVTIILGSISKMVILWNPLLPPKLMHALCLWIVIQGKDRFLYWKLYMFPWKYTSFLYRDPGGSLSDAHKC